MTSEQGKRASDLDLRHQESMRRILMFSAALLVQLAEQAGLDTSRLEKATDEALAVQREMDEFANELGLGAG